MNSMEPSPSITPSIASSSKRHTRKIISINPIKKFIARNLIRSHPSFTVIRQEHYIKISHNTPRPYKGTKIPPQKPSSHVCGSTINTCKAKTFIIQMTSYIIKLFIYQEISDQIRNQQTPKLSRFINNRRLATKCILTNLKRTSKASVYDTIGSVRKTRRGLCSLSKLINISTILWFPNPLTFQKNEETFIATLWRELS